MLALSNRIMYQEESNDGSNRAHVRHTWSLSQSSSLSASRTGGHIRRTYSSSASASPSASRIRVRIARKIMRDIESQTSPSIFHHSDCKCSQCTAFDNCKVSIGGHFQLEARGSPKVIVCSHRQQAYIHSRSGFVHVLFYH